MARQTIVRVKHIAATHQSGTKFYEMFLFENEFGGLFVTRYGKTAQLERGGQEAFEPGTPEDSENRWDSKRRAKFSSKGGYEHDVTWNLSGRPSAVLRDRAAPDHQTMFDMTKEYDASALKASMADIFGTDAIFDQVCDALNLPGADDIEIVPMPVFAEVSEEDRAADTSWGAW